jgi:hypothetical protein
MHSLDRTDVRVCRQRAQQLWFRRQRLRRPEGQELQRHIKITGARTGVKSIQGELV